MTGNEILCYLYSYCKLIASFTLPEKAQYKITHAQFDQEEKAVPF